VELISQHSTFAAGFLHSGVRGEFHKRRGGGAQFRRHREFVGVVLETFRALKKWARGCFTQVTKRLANGSQTRVVVGRDVDVWEALSGDLSA
jgi:hypothetical protein